MARRRMIDPNFWESEDVSKLTIRQRLLLIGLFSNADDEGKIRGNPAFVRSAVFRYDDFTLSDIEQDLNMIESIGSIEQYDVCGSRYIRLVNWKKFQRVDKPQPSVIPNPVRNDSENDSENGSDTDSCLKEEKGKEVKGEEKGREMPALDSNPHKDRLLALINRMNIIGFNLAHLDIVYSYIGIADIEVIEHCIKKSQNKPHSYLTNTLNGVICLDKLTRKEQLPGAKVGENNEKPPRVDQYERADAEDKPYTGGATGWLPSKFNKGTVVQMPKVSG